MRGFPSGAHEYVHTIEDAREPEVEILIGIAHLIEYARGDRCAAGPGTAGHR